MDVAAYQRETFKRGSTTYFNSSLFFPEKIRRRVFTLYAFVRRADDLVDSIPQREAEFYAFRSFTRDVLAGREDLTPPALLSQEDRGVILAYGDLAREVGFSPSWTEAFLDAMQADLTKSRYDTLEETLGYVYGSAEVIGLFMCACMGITPEAYPTAQLLGRAMQYINFIRDMDEDRRLNRRYLPLDGADERIIDPAWARDHPGEFQRWITIQLERFRTWQIKALQGYAYLPYRFRLPIVTASDMYWWTAETIERDPLIVFEKKVKPRRGRIVRRLIRNFFIEVFR
jgi:phytoene synthase